MFAESNGGVLVEKGFNRLAEADVVGSGARRESCAVSLWESVNDVVEQGGDLGGGSAGIYMGDLFSEGISLGAGFDPGLEVLVSDECE